MVSWPQQVDPVSRARDSVKGSNITCKAHRAMVGSVSTTHDLQKPQLVEVGSDLSEAHREMKLRRFVRAELFFTLMFIGTTLVSALGAVSMPLLLIIAVFTAWFATISLRLYWHHLKCLKRMVGPNAQQCPCSSALPLATDTPNDHAMGQQAVKKGCMVANQYSRL